MKAQNFKQFINENEEDSSKIEDRLRDLGLAPKKEFDERWYEMVDAWGSDPEINAAIDLLKRKTDSYLEKYIEFDDPEDEQEFGQRQEWIMEQGIDDLGWLEYIIASQQY